MKSDNVFPKQKIGWFTTFSAWGSPNHCAWYGCRKKRHKGSFCEEHGQIKVKVGIIDK